MAWLSGGDWTNLRIDDLKYVTSELLIALNERQLLIGPVSHVGAATITEANIFGGTTTLPTPADFEGMLIQDMIALNASSKPGSANLPSAIDSMSWGRGYSPPTGGFSKGHERWTNEARSSYLSTRGQVTGDGLWQSHAVGDALLMRGLWNQMKAGFNNLHWMAWSWLAEAGGIDEVAYSNEAHRLGSGTYDPNDPGFPGVFSDTHEDTWDDMRADTPSGNPPGGDGNQGLDDSLYWKFINDTGADFGQVALSNTALRLTLSRPANNEIEGAHTSSLLVYFATYKIDSEVEETEFETGVYDGTNFAVVMSPGGSILVLDTLNDTNVVTIKDAAGWSNPKTQTVINFSHTVPGNVPWPTTAEFVIEIAKFQVGPPPDNSQQGIINARVKPIVGKLPPDPGSPDTTVVFTEFVTGTHVVN